MPAVAVDTLIRAVLAVGWMTAVTAVQAQQKAPIPDAEAEKHGRQATRELFGEKFDRAKTIADRLALAKEMRDTACKVQNGSADQYALLVIANSLAVSAGDVPAAMDAVDMLATRFEVSAAKLKAEALLALAKPTPRSNQQKAVAEEAVKILGELAITDDYETALGLCRVAQTFSKNTRQPALTKELKAWEENLEQQEASYQAYRQALAVLKVSPADEAANLATGRHLCIVKQDWERGLPRLAKGSDAELQALAKKDLKSPEAAEEQVALGDDWWTLAETRKDWKEDAVRLRAGSWYQLAEPNLPATLSRVRIADRLAKLRNGGAELPAPAPKSRTTVPRPPAPAVAPFNEGQAKDAQLRWAGYLKAPPVLTNSIGMKLILIPPGEFDMGSTAEEVGPFVEKLRKNKAPDWMLGHVISEQPKHRVKIQKPFYLGVYEVTQAEYEKVMGNNPSEFKGVPNCPVEQVLWDDAVEFCRKVSELRREKEAAAAYRLPTEAEWEYACRAGTATLYSFGDDARLLAQHGWFWDNSQGHTQPVGRLRPNAWGLFDMHGGAFEWCADYYATDYYQHIPGDDPRGPESGWSRVIRGGAWHIGDAEGLRSGLRDSSPPDRRNRGVGFRLVRTAGP